VKKSVNKKIRKQGSPFPSYR